MGILDRTRLRKVDSARCSVSHVKDKEERSDSCANGAYACFGIFFWRRAWHIRCFRLL